jgi:hypothetical protein
VVRECPISNQYPRVVEDDVRQVLGGVCELGCGMTELDHVIKICKLTY